LRASEPRQGEERYWGGKKEYARGEKKGGGDGCFFFFLKKQGQCVIGELVSRDKQTYMIVRRQSIARAGYRSVRDGMIEIQCARRKTVQCG